MGLKRLETPGLQNAVTGKAKKGYLGKGEEEGRLAMYSHGPADKLLGTCIQYVSLEPGLQPLDSRSTKST